MTDQQTQLSLFDDVVVSIPAPQPMETKSALPTEGHALTFGSVPTKAAKESTSQGARRTTPLLPKSSLVPQEQVTRTVEPDFTAKLRVTLSVYRQLCAVANHVIPQLEALLNGVERNDDVLDSASAFRIAKSALESPILHAAIQVQACIVAPPVITETRIEIPTTQAKPLVQPTLRNNGNVGRTSSPIAAGKHLPMVPFVLAVAEQQHPYRLPTIKKFAALYITPERIRIRNEHGQETNRTHQELWCIQNEATYHQAEQLYTAYQLALDTLAARYRAYGNYKDQLAAAGGATIHAKPLCSFVIRLENPDKQ